jgi:large subunit ribosomal protein L22
MEVRSIYRSARISAFKAREVTRQIQGLPATDALDLLRFTPKKAASLISQTLKSAVANAENNNNLRVDLLVVKEAVVGEGPTMKRFIPKARGSAGPIRKRSSHIRIILTDEIPIVRRDKKTKKTQAPKSEKPARKKNQAATPAPETTPATTPVTEAPQSKE